MTDKDFGRKPKFGPVSEAKKGFPPPPPKNFSTRAVSLYARFGPHGFFSRQATKPEPISPRSRAASWN